MNIYLNRAQLLMQQQRFELAEEQLHLALMEGEDASIAHALLALCLLERDQFDRATEEAEQAIHASPDEALGFYALASIQQKRRHFTEARATIAEAIRLEPWNAMHFYVLAEIETQTYQWTQALAAAEQGLACDPENSGCNNLRAIALVKLGRNAEAGQSIDVMLSRNPDDAVTHANQGWTLLHQRQPQEAMKHFREALRLEPNLEWARLGIIEAMKARFFVYRWLLTWLLWLSKFPPNVQLGLMLGLVFGRSVLASLLQMVPILKPLELPLTVFYILFVWMNWTASSLFNLILRLDSFGRLVLNDKEKLESTLVAICLGACLLIGSSSLLVDRRLVFIPWQVSLLYLGLMIPLVSVIHQPLNLRKIFGGYAVGLSIVILIASYHELHFCYVLNSLIDVDPLPAEQLSKLKVLAGTAAMWRQYSIYGIVLSTWIGAGANLAPRRR